MLRTFRVMVLMNNAISGAGKYSPSAFPNKPLPLEYASIEGKKIAYVGGMGIVEPISEVQNSIREAIALFEKAGATVDVVHLDLGLSQEEISPRFRDMVLSGAMGAGMASYESHFDKMMPYAQSFIQQAANGDFGKENLVAAELLVKDL